MIILQQDGYLEKKGSFTCDGFVFENWYCHKCKTAFQFKWSSPEPQRFRIVHEIVPVYGHRAIKLR